MSNTIDNLIPLLQRWSELAPDECAVKVLKPSDNLFQYVVTYKDHAIEIGSTGYIAVRIKGHYISQLYSAEFGEILVEGAIREAIEKRERDWLMCNSSVNDQGGMLNHASVGYASRPDGRCESEDEATITESLLTAYIKALEAIKEN